MSKEKSMEEWLNKMINECYDNKDMQREFWAFGQCYKKLKRCEQNPETGSVGGVAMRFEDVALGARFQYKGHDKIWIKIDGSGEGLVAEYDGKYICDPEWVGQTIACAAGTVEEMENLKVIVIG